MNAINNLSSKSGNKQHGATTSKSTAAAKFPSGLVLNWQTKVLILKVSHSTQDHQHARSPLGGLSDDDAHAELVSDIPDLKHKSHKNEVGFYSNLQCKLY